MNHILKIRNGLTAVKVFLPSFTWNSHCLTRNIPEGLQIINGLKSVIYTA